jgi:ubiquinone/menaquinone biosynthesis C-methylase UbiE
MERKEGLTHIYKHTLRSGMRVLDLGCGSGGISCELARSIRTGEVIGVDSSEAILQQAQQLKDSEGIDNITFFQGNAYALSFPDETFDFIYSRFLFQHLADPSKALLQVYRILKPGGTLCVLDVDENWFTLYPEPESFVTLRQILVTVQQSQGGDPFVGRKLGSYFDAAGFRQVKTLIHAVSSDELGLNHFFDLLSFGTPYQNQREDLAEIATKARKDVYSLLSLPYAWAGVGLLTAIGCKS